MTTSGPKSLPPALTLMHLSVPIRQLSVALTAASQSASQPLGNGEGAGKKSSFTVPSWLTKESARQGSDIEAILHIFTFWPILPQELDNTRIPLLGPGGINADGIPDTELPFSRVTITVEVGNRHIICSNTFLICATQAHFASSPAGPLGPIGPTDP